METGLLTALAPMIWLVGCGLALIVVLAVMVTR
jgi:hypothetical protein